MAGNTAFLHARMGRALAENDRDEGWAIGLELTDLGERYLWPSKWGEPPSKLGLPPLEESPSDSRDRRPRFEAICPDTTDPDLFMWWMQTALDDLVTTTPKASEYGGRSAGPATDLILIGRNLAELLDMHDAPDSLLMELGVWFYMQGKVARLVADYQQRRQGKADTWFDASVYAKMARRIQETGQWP